MTYTVNQAKRDRRRGEGRRPRAAGRQPVPLARSLLEGEKGHRRRPAWPGGVGVGRLRAQQHGTRRRVELHDRSRRHREDARLEGVPRPGAEAGVRAGALLPVAEVLGLLGRHRDRPLLPHDVAAAAGDRRRLPGARLGVGRHLRAEGSRGARHVLHERRLSRPDDAAGLLGDERRRRAAGDPRVGRHAVRRPGQRGASATRRWRSCPIATTRTRS